MGRALGARRDEVRLGKAPKSLNPPFKVPKPPPKLLSQALNCCCCCSTQSASPACTGGPAAPAAPPAPWPRPAPPHDVMPAQRHWGSGTATLYCTVLQLYALYWTQNAVCSILYAVHSMRYTRHIVYTIPYKVHCMRYIVSGKL